VAGRLFPATNSSKYALDFLKKSTMYYANERNDTDVNGTLTHPLVDLFFLSDKDELVLVDITGGGSREVKEEKNNSPHGYKKSKTTY
jgi:hypothetical protein